MTLRSRADGIVIKRSAVQGNYYDSKDELMEIAPLDHLKVWVTPSELDADKVELGQKIRIIFPFSDQEVEAAVEYIDKAIDPETRAARFRAPFLTRRNDSRRGCSCGSCWRSPPSRGTRSSPEVPWSRSIASTLSLSS